ncbi:MAG: FkbM family methyltransferase [Halobacteriovoraceae bacterium]|nr:FkbM family methyltransferase [Halobacteriovoraceae bacterium]MCB9094102.1 FkbM family methyltransferase [Halobacteriovoraceae bacterium]
MEIRATFSIKNYLDNKVAMFRTSTKLGIVRLMFLVTAFFYKLRNKSLNNITATRNNINWLLDLNEAIDYCLYISGEYEPDLIHLYKHLIENKDWVVLDIGANIGAHSLIMAKMMGRNAKVYALEPTKFAFQKLTQNIRLNEDLKEKVLPRNILLTNESQEVAITQISSSWDISKKISDSERNPYDGGFYKSTENATRMTLDQFIQSEKIKELDLIKLDVDGNEVDILRGSRSLFKTHRPILLVELSPIHFDHHPYQFSDLVEELSLLDYDFFSVEGKKIELNSEQIEKWIPHGTLVNIIGYPKNL